MIWEAHLSFILALAGIAGGIYNWQKNGPASLWMPLAFFGLMGALQDFSHEIANECGMPANQVATLLGYLHICFQPFFLNAAGLHFIDVRVARRIDLPVYTLCFTGLIIMLIQAYPINWAGHCERGSFMCGETLCALRDSWQLAYTLPLNQVQEQMPWLFICGIVLPLLYGSWRFITLYALTCPLLAYAVTQNSTEWPVLASILAIAFFWALNSYETLSQQLFVRRWLGWRMIAA